MMLSSSSGPIQVLRNVVGGAEGVRFPGKKSYEDVRTSVQRY